MTVKIICPKTAFFAGHRKLPAGTMQISAALEKELTARIESGHRFFGAGGATGVDTVAALSVLRFWEMHPSYTTYSGSAAPSTGKAPEQKRYRSI